MSLKKSFGDVLEELDFSVTVNVDDNLPEIIFTANPPSNLHPKHLIALEYAKILKADGVYFKYYDDNRFCSPQIYFFDNSNNLYDKNQIAEIHRNVYSSCQVNLICVIDKTTVSLFDTRKAVKIKSASNDISLFDEVDTISNDHCLIIENFSINNLAPLSKFFSAKKLNTGMFWESDEASKHFFNNTSAYEELVKALLKIRIDFRKVLQSKNAFTDTNSANDLADDLLFKCILIKYLEENGKDYAEQFYKDKNLDYTSLYDFLYNNKFLSLLEKLENHFNGNVFSIDDSIKQVIEGLNLSDLAECLEGKLASNRSLYLWKMYSFKYIPIELISNFYEEFIPKTDANKGTVYTPSFLVNLLIDECLPLSKSDGDLNYNVKLADVSCGSGIFITSAFKRLVQRWRVANMADQQLAIPTLEIVQRILTDNIFGVDIHPTSVKLSKFSLLLALCQLVPNEELWYKWSDENVFKDTKRKVFLNLDKNVFEKDYFDFLAENKNFHNSFDWIIGNPPFKLIGKTQYTKYVNTLKKINFNFEIEVPRSQLALMFLETSSILLKKGGNLCFIQKSTSLIHNKKENSQTYKNHLFNKFHIYQVIDFTLLKDVLFEKALVETCAIFYRKEKLEEYNTLHIVSRLLKNTKDGISFEFDFYDFFEIPKYKILSSANIWRINLLGGNRLLHLVEKLEIKSANQTFLEEYLYKNLSISKERYAEGYMVQNKNTKNPETADFINGKYALTANLFELNTYELKRVEPDVKFHRSRNKSLFTAPQIIIKESLIGNEIPMVFSEEQDIPFDSRIIGISAEKDKIDDLKKVYNVLLKNQKIYALKTIATCSQFYFRGDTAIQKQDIDRWPISLTSDEIQLTYSESIVLNDTLNYIYPSWNLGDKSAINQIILEENEMQTLTDFATVFNQSFNSIYHKDNKKQQLQKILKGNTFYALEFCYSDVNYNVEIVDDKNDSTIEELIFNNYSRNAVVNRVMKIYGTNSVILIKPKKLRYWLQSIALRDADDVFDDMINAGY